jgi:2-haloacid dehalogenase
MSDNAVDEALRRARVLTFDCYGTLVDWRAGLTAALDDLFGPLPRERMNEIFTAYLTTEALVESGSYRSYREVLSTVLSELAWQFDLDIPSDAQGESADRRDALAESLPSWPIFEDTTESLHRLQRRYRLGVLSNVDRDLFAETQRRIGVTFDFVVTAQDVRSYKPAHAHFRDADAGLPRYAEAHEVLHVAQSLFHDGAAARELNLAYVWINRYNQENDTDVAPLATFPDLRSLADRLVGAR